MRLEGKVALVTGGGSGIGEGIVRRFAAEGAIVYLGDVDVQRGQAIAAETGARFLSLDVSSSADWARIATDIGASHGQLDILVNNAGVISSQAIDAIEEAAWARVMAVNVTGSIAARRDALVGVNGEGGLVTAVLVDAGQLVRKGQVLATIDHSVQEQQVASMAAGIVQAKADAALAQANLDRAVKLVDKGFISRADIDQKTATRDGNLAKVKVAEAQFGEMKARMARLDVRAPSAGLVLSRNVETGQIVGSGSNSLFRIAENGIIEMRALVAEQDLAKLKVGMPATVRLVGSNAEFHGKIWLIDPVIDNLSRQGVARIAIVYSPGLRVGAFANASIAAGNIRQPVLPQSAVQVDGTTSYVYVIDADNKVVRRPVTVGQVTAQGLGISRGLDGTEKVVASSAAFLQPGEKVVPVVQKQG